MDGIRKELEVYIEAYIIPQYAGFDKAHQIDHVRKVIANSMTLAQLLSADASGAAVDAEMVYAIAAYHDIGLPHGRENHEQSSATHLLADAHLRTWFSRKALHTMAEAVADHRASSQRAPRSLYGCIVAEADRDIDYMTILTRTLQYSLANFPDFSQAQHFERTYAHLHEKYGENGYMRLWLDIGPNKQKLDDMRRNMKSKEGVRTDFNALYAEQMNI